MRRKQSLLSPPGSRTGIHFYIEEGLKPSSLFCPTIGISHVKWSWRYTDTIIILNLLWKAPKITFNFHHTIFIMLLPWHIHSVGDSFTACLNNPIICLVFANLSRHPAHRTNSQSPICPPQSRYVSWLSGFNKLLLIGFGKSKSEE